MAKVVKPLTVTQIEYTQPKDKDFSLCDGDGLYLRIRSSGKKTWVFLNRTGFVGESIF